MTDCHLVFTNIFPEVPIDLYYQTRQYMIFYFENHNFKVFFTAIFTDIPKQITDLHKCYAKTELSIYVIIIS